MTNGLRNANHIPSQVMLQNPSKNSACCGHLASKTLPFDFEYMKIMYMNCGLRNEYESGVCINEHYLSSSENEA